MGEDAPQAGDPEDRIIDGSGGIRLAVQDHGGPDGAPTIVLVHGYPDDHHVWDLVVPHLLARHHVVTYDVRGAGASAAPTATAGYRLHHLVADLVAVADATSPGRPVHVVGHDWGSIQSWSAVLDPAAATRIASYTSQSGPALEHVARWTAARRRPGGRRWSQALRQAVSSWYIYAFHTPLAPLAWRHGLARRWPVLLRRSEGVPTDATWPGPGLTRDAVNGIGLYRANMFRSLRRVTDARTDVPVQLVIARRDAFVTPGLLDGIEELAPDLVRVELDAPHWAPRKQPGRLATLIAEHVERVEARP